MNNSEQDTIPTEEAEGIETVVNAQGILVPSPTLFGGSKHRPLEAPAITRELGFPLEPITVDWVLRRKQRRFGWEDRSCLRFD